VTQDVDDEIDLKELALSLWAGKSLMVACMLFATVFAVGYALIKKPEYTSTAVFEITQANNRPSLPSEFSGLAALAGVNASSNSKGLFDRLVGRDFVLRLDQEVDLLGDEYFNPVETSEPTLSAKAIKAIKQLLQPNANEQAPISADAYVDVVKTYRDNVKVSETSNGSIEVVVTHEDPERSATIANAIVKRAIEETQSERLSEQRKQLGYLSGELAKALTNMEATKRAVANFALANSLQASGEFAQRSELMASLREDLERTLEMAYGVAEVTELLEKAGTPTQEDFALLRAQVSVVDDVDFRRLLGIPEALNAWEFPSKTRLDAFANTLDDRLSRIKRSINELSQEAEEFAESTEQLSTLRREAAIAEATYNVLMEQVKIQSVTAGYQSEPAKLYQSAVAPSVPSAPKKSLIVALGLVLGGFVGAAITLALNASSGVIYSSHTIAQALGFPPSKKMPFSTRVKGTLQNTLAKMSRLPLMDLGEASLTISKYPNRPIIVAATGSDIDGLPFSVWLANFVHKSRQRTQPNAKPVGVLLVGGAIPKGLTLEPTSDPSLLSGSVENITFFTPSADISPTEIFGEAGLKKLLKNADSFEHSGLIIVTSAEYSAIALSALSDANAICLAVTKPGKSERDIIAKTSKHSNWTANICLEKS